MKFIISLLLIMASMPAWALTEDEKAAEAICNKHLYMNGSTYGYNSSINFTYEEQFSVCSKIMAIIHKKEETEKDQATKDELEKLKKIGSALGIKECD